MSQDFINSKKLVFEKGKGGGNLSLWGGVDTASDHKFELFFVAEEEGPSARQISTYGEFLDRIDQIGNDILAETKSQIEAKDAGLHLKIGDSPITIDIVYMDSERTELELELACSIKYKEVAFTKNVDVLARLHDFQIAWLEIY